jgi:lipopolysaccharide biosynthesis glycosyltransferase
MISERFDIAMGYDGNYAPHAASTIASVVRHSPGTRFRFLMLYADIPPDLKARVERAAPGQDFVWIAVNYNDMPTYTANEKMPYINRTTLFRLGLEFLAPSDARRVLYLDADLIVLNDVRELLELPFESHPLAAVEDAFLDADKFASRWNLPAGGGYLNAGVLLLDLEEIRREKLLTKALDFLAQNGAQLPFADQDALNWAFWKRWRVLDNCWNVQRQPGIVGEKRGESAPAIVHFTTQHKPWLAGMWHPWSWIYWDNLARTPFFDEVARREGVSFWTRQRLRLRWMRRRPQTRKRTRSEQSS